MPAWCHALLRAGAGGRVASFFLSAAILRRSASMRLMARRGTVQLCFGCGGMPACFACEMRHQGFLIAVAETGGIEGPQLAVENMRGKPEHLGRRSQLRNVGKIVRGTAHLIRVTQCRADEALVVGLERDHPLTLGEHEPAERHHGLAAHRLPDHRKGILPDRIVGGDVVGRVEETLVDIGARHETVDVDRVAAGDLDRLQLLILHEEILALADLVAAGLVVRLDGFAGLLVDELLAQPVAGLAVDLPERNSLR